MNIDRENVLMSQTLRTAVIAGIALCFSQGLASQYRWDPQFPSLSTFASPVELIHSQDSTNRFFVVQLRGIIYVFKNDPAVNSRKMFLNLSDRVSQSGSETGLLGLAFHPRYPDTPFFYVNYTRLTDTLRTYIARYTVSTSNPDSAVRESEKILLTYTQPYTNHNGGRLEFGPDGYLYIASGDGGSANDPGNRALNRSQLLGKILRINVDSTEGNLSYAIPKTNPLADNTSGYRKEIFAYGLRNPWKFSFDKQTGTLWAGDVGQDLREEIDTIVSGGNYGWRLMEGIFCNPTVNPSCQDTAGLLRPVFDYANLNPPNEGSITGGYVYRGSAIMLLHGKYIYGDYISGRTFALAVSPGSPPVNTQLTDESFGISTFGTDAQGNLFLCSYGNSGRIYKLSGPATSVPPMSSTLPQKFSLRQNFPNPFNPSTTIQFTLPQTSSIRITVYDALGRKTAVLMDEYCNAGEHTVRWGADEYPAGMYFVQMNAGIFSETIKIILLK